MDILCWIFTFILIPVVITDGGSEALRHHYRSRARHILVQNLGIRQHHQGRSDMPTTAINPTTQTTTHDTTTTAEPLSTTAQSQHDTNEAPTRRRGSQSPDSYTEGEWELIQQRIGNPPPGGSSESGTNEESRQDQHHNQNGQDTQPTRQPEGQGQDPFLNRMSAMDYLTRRAHGNILSSRNNQQNREFSREMGEQMCEAFGKHYVSISIGGKCV